MNPRKLSWIQHLNNYFTIEEINMYPLDESDSTEVVLLQETAIVPVNKLTMPLRDTTFFDLYPFFQNIY